MIVAVIAALACAPASSGCPGGEALASRAVALIERVEKVGVSRQAPELTGRVSDSEGELLETVDLYPGKGFVYPELVTDRALAKEVRRFWSSGGKNLLCAAPHMTDEYEHRDGPVQQAIGVAIQEIFSVTFREPDRELVMVPLMLRIIESQGTEARLRRALLGEVAGRMTSGQHIELLEWGRALEPGAENRVDWIAALRAGRPGAVPKQSREHLLEISERDPCHDCRVMSIQDRQMIELGEERVRPIYERLLAEAIESRDRAMMEVLTLALRGGAHTLTSIPSLLPGLDSADPYIRAMSVGTLVSIADVDEPREFHLVPVLYNKDNVPPEDQAILERSVLAWKAWWAKKGRALFETGDLTEVRKSAEKVYSSRSDY